MGNPAKKLTIGPQAYNHFWPRLWLTAKPLGLEARQCQKTGGLPDCHSPLDNIDTRIFVRGGDWVSAHLDLIACDREGDEGANGGAGTNVEGPWNLNVGSGARNIYKGGGQIAHVGSNQDSLMGCQRNAGGTCILFSEGSPLYERAADGRRPSCVQGIVSCVHPDRGTVDLKISADKGGTYSRMSLSVTNQGIWWCFPYWVAASRTVHGGKVPVDVGFYFLAKPGQEFQVVTVNWADQDFLTKNSVDGASTSSDQWFLPARGIDKSPVVSCLYESSASETHAEGARFAFKERPKVREPRRGWEEDLKTEAGVVCETIFAIDPMEAEPDPDEDDVSEEESSDDTGGSDPDFEEELSQKARRAHSRKRAAVRKSGPPKKKGKFSHHKQSRESDSAGSSKPRGPVEQSTPVKQDSKWALHRSLAPTRGPPTSDSFCTIDLKAGAKLGKKRAHYREASWFANVDLLLQEEGLAARRSSAARTSLQPGQSPAKPIEFPDSDDDVSEPPARASAEARQHLQTPKPEPGCYVSTPSKSVGTGSAGHVSTLGGDVSTPPKSVKAEPRGNDSMSGGRPKLLKVKFYGKGKLGLPLYVVQVPRSGSITQVKSQAKQALAEPDVAGSFVLSARLRWTFVDEDGSEVDISKHTTADDIDKSPSINVYMQG